MDRNELDSCFIQSLSYYVNGFDDDLHYTTLEQLGCEIDYDVNGHTIITSWTLQLCSEPSIAQLMGETYADVMAYWRVLQLPSTMVGIESCTTAEGVIVAALNPAPPQGGLLIINNVLSAFIGSTFVALH
jgi:hypothetical protein